MAQTTMPQDAQATGPGTTLPAAQLDYLVRHMTEAIVVTQADQIVFANPRVAELCGYEPAELGSRGLRDLLHPDDLERIIAVSAQRARGELTGVNRSRFRIIRKDGTVRWIASSADTIEWNGSIATLAFLNDVTEVVELETRLKDTLAEREMILENSIIATVFLNAAGRMRWCNSATERMFGAERGSFIGTSIEPFYTSRDDYLRIGQAVAEAVQRGVSYESEIQMRRRDGSLFWVSLSGKAVNPQDLGAGTIWVLADISQRKQLETELSRAFAEREAILNSAVAGICHLKDQKLRWVNQTLLRMVGYEVNELMGRHFAMLLSDPSKAGMLAEQAYAQLDAAGHHAFEIELKRRDGTLLWVEIAIRAVRNEAAAFGTIATIVDITARREAEANMRRSLEQQRELNDLRSRFISMTSHEFRTPLAAILSSAELLRDYHDKLPAEDRMGLIGSIERSVRRMAELLDQVLVIGRADADRLEFKPEPVDLSAFFGRTVREACAQVDGSKAALRVDLDLTGACGKRLLDDRLMQHIVGNLLTNALKYSPQDQRAQCAVRCQPEAVLITVTDAGIGIPADDLPHLFEPFHRARNVGTVSGTGLGLSIVKRAVDLHGGTIAVDSAPGRGTTFTVTLPAPLEAAS